MSARKVTAVLTGTVAVPAAAAAATMLIAAPASAAPATHATHAAKVRVWYPTKVTGLRVRSGPSTRFRTLHVLGRAGTLVRIRCYKVGQRINGDPIWYNITKPYTGYVSGFWLRTGPDPAPGIPRC